LGKSGGSSSPLRARFLPVGHTGRRVSSTEQEALPADWTDSSDGELDAKNNAPSAPFLTSRAGMCLAPTARYSYEPGATPQGSVRKNSISTESAIHLHTWRLSIEPNASPDSRFQRWLGGKLFVASASCRCVPISRAGSPCHKLPQAGMISALGAKQIRARSAPSSLLFARR
jgi:hypothetical protein